MTSEKNHLYQNVRDILQKISQQEGFIKPQIECSGKIGKGQGFMGDVFYVNITDENSSRHLKLVVKQSTSSEYVRKNFPVKVICFNESYFYKQIWPKFVELQLNHLQSIIFNNIAKCYETDLDEGKESFVLENLNAMGYFVLKKDQFFDRNQVESVLKKYGQFHGLSFAYKSKHFEEFQTLSKELIPCWKMMSEAELFKFVMEKGLKDCLTYLDYKKQRNIITKLEGILENVVQVFQNSTTYRGKYGVIVQGDCWSNNVLFKCKENSKLEDLKLIDFQMSNVSTVVNDLSYCLYAGGTKEIFDDLDRYLRIYHESLVDTCSRFDCKDFISFENLKTEWKEYSKFGFILGLSLIRTKLSEDMDQEEMAQMSKTEEDQEKVPNENSEKIKQKCLELVLHMYENGFL
ncbi:uncharacterized protein LOC114326388 [Diabrotica virgifera virgifera]|uniref:Uncharacterized protein LOC114326388 n=1 Tax=Diabrotica virgifera virgifera TaxID=50390 RepID=A0A6P7F4D3_DIAVI|nr:uncharacterized protein LOC114326388 [Diabrotica virgifera virgifera]